MFTKFTGLLKEIIDDYPTDLPWFLETNLQIPDYKAKELAERLERNFNLRIHSEIRQNRIDFSPKSELPKKQKPARFSRLILFLASIPVYSKRLLISISAS